MMWWEESPYHNPFHSAHDTKVPPGWDWLQQCSFFYWSSLAIADDVLGAITYTCGNNGSFSIYDTTSQTCNVPVLVGKKWPWLVLCPC